MINGIIQRYDFLKNNKKKKIKLLTMATGIRNVINPAIKNSFGEISVQLKTSKLITATKKIIYFKF